jgi:hypothetical protein
LDEVYNLRGITPLTKPFSVEELVGWGLQFKGNHT